MASENVRNGLLVLILALLVATLSFSVVTFFKVKNEHANDKDITTKAPGPAPGEFECWSDF